jgi:hypothetical protein
MHKQVSVTAVSTMSPHWIHSPEIRTQHFRGRVPIRHINGPDASTRSYIKNALRVLPYGRFVQFPL